MKRIVLTALLSVCLLFSQTSAVWAVVPEVEQHQEAVRACLDGSINLECQSSTTFKQGTAVPLVLGILGGEPQLIADAYGNKKVISSRGLIGDIGDAIAFFYQTKPADNVAFVRDMLQTAGIAQPAYAQGIGFASLTPILETWKKFRNIAYFFFVAIFVAIGFMIMLRQKIGGQSAVTAQQAIPRVIVTLLFVTFSYAIAGLLIDGMYLVMFMLLGLFGKQTDQFVGMNFLELGFKMVTSGGTAAFEVVSEFSKQATDQHLGDFGGELLGFFPGLTMMVIVAIAIALNIFVLFFELLKTYVIIVLSIVFSPVLLMMGALPNSKDVFGSWVKNLIGNLAAFPAVLLVLIVFDELTGGISGGLSKIENGGFLPPYLFGRSAGAGAASSLTFAVGLGTLLIMPQIVKKVKETMGAKSGVFEQFAGDIGNALKKGWSGGQVIPGLGFTTIPGAAKIGKGVAVGASAGGNALATGTYFATSQPDQTLGQRAQMFGMGANEGWNAGGAKAAKTFKADKLFPAEQKKLGAVTPKP